MGCPKLAYKTNDTALKVVHRKYAGNENSCTGSYRYGFNGKEKDDEVKGSGNSYDFGARIYDPRLGRWLSTDPLQAKYPNLSPYNFCANSPIILIDKDGRDFDYAIRDIKNSDGSMTRVVDITVVYNVVNLSSKEVNSGDFNTATAQLSKGLDYAAIAPYLKGVKDVKINVDVEFNIVTDFSKINDNQNILLLVNSVVDGGEGEKAGWGTLGGNVAILEAGTLEGAGEVFSTGVVHEVGHNLNLEHDDSKKGAMNKTLQKNSSLHKGQQKEFDDKYQPAYKGKNGDKGHVGQGGSKAKAKEMLRTKGSGYDNAKARKAKVE